MATPPPYADLEESVTKQGIKATAQIETVLQPTMPTGFSAHGKYQVITSYQAATDQEAELSEEQSQRGRALAKRLRERVEKQLRRASWSEVITLSGEQTLLGKNGLTL